MSVTFHRLSMSYILQVTCEPLHATSTFTQLFFTRVCSVFCASTDFVTLATLPLLPFCLSACCVFFGAFALWFCSLLRLFGFVLFLALLLSNQQTNKPNLKIQVLLYKQTLGWVGCCMGVGRRRRRRTRDHRRDVQLAAALRQGA